MSYVNYDPHNYAEIKEREKFINENAGDWYHLYGDEYGLAQDLAHKQNMDSAKRQEEFQLFMSSSSHQREVNDLLAAGLNPVLSANNGASTGQGAYANVDTSASNSKLAEKQLKQQLENQTKIESMKVANEQKIAEQNRKMQYQIAQDQIASQQYINKYNTDMSFALGTYQSDNNLRGTTYSADSAKEASFYGTDKSFENSNLQRAWQSSEYNNERNWQTEEGVRQRTWQGNQNRLDRSVQKYGIRRGYDASVYGSNAAAGASRYAASVNAAASRYGSKMTHDASIYASDINFQNAQSKNRNELDKKKMDIYSDPTKYATWKISQEAQKTASRSHGAYYFGYE